MSEFDFDFTPPDSFNIPHFSKGEDKKNLLKSKNYTQWAFSDGKYIPMKNTVSEIQPGLYEIEPMKNGKAPVFFERVELNTENLIKFPNSKFEEVVSGIKDFWEKESIFRNFDLAFKRGVLLHGIPGTGKSCLIKLLMKDVIDRGGIVVNFDRVGPFKMGMRIFREIHPDKPVVVVMEDLDSILANNNESSVLNILDGVTKIDKVVYLATTNNPETLDQRIVNRPSRFDKIYEIGNLNKESRELYFNFLFSKTDSVNINDYNIDKWIEDTKNFTISHLHELFVAVVILEDEYSECLNKLKEMKNNNKLENNAGSKTGF